MTNKNKTSLGTYPLKGVFEPIFFTLPQIDIAMLKFLREIVMHLTDYLSVSMLVFFHHPLFGSSDNIFFRWVSWEKTRKIRNDLLKKFEKSNPKHHIALNLKECTPEETLAAAFLKKLNEALATQPYKNIKRLEGFTLKPKSNTHKMEVIERQDENSFWFIENPGKFKAFKETLQGNKTAWSIYHPLFISGRLIGLFVVDGADSGINGVPLFSRTLS